MRAARSAAVLVALKWRVPRSAVLDEVRLACGADLTGPATDDRLASAMVALSNFRDLGLPPHDIPKR